MEAARKCLGSSCGSDTLDAEVRRQVRQFLYSDSGSRRVHVSQMVQFRERPPPTATRRKRLPAACPADQQLQLQQQQQEQQADEEAVDEDSYRYVGWDLQQRGAVGETCLHLCFLSGTRLHMQVARSIIRTFPSVVNDIYMSDIFYGESVLHIAICNEDADMVQLLLQHGANVHQRCFGTFFCPEDQKQNRVSYIDDEFIDLPLHTNYEGHVYWGEYPLSFAACCGQEKCIRLLLAHGADPNRQDSNGNTVLHILVIHEPKMDSKMAQKLFVLLHTRGASLHIRNRLGLTPLTLAAKLARRLMHSLIMHLDSEVRLRYGSTVCMGHPLEQLDSVGEDGVVNKDSSLMLIAFGSKLEHLDMLEGVVAKLLLRKWNSYVRPRFYRMFASFALYFACFLATFLLRPGTDKFPAAAAVNTTLHNGTVYSATVAVRDTCYLLSVANWQSCLRLGLEAVLLTAAITNMSFLLHDMMQQGCRVYMRLLMATPMRCLYQVSQLLLLLMVPCRAACAHTAEDYLSVFAILFTAPYFLFFCRGFKLVGPFVLMVYRMVTGDLLRFCVIYVIFMLGFSQAMFIVFRSVQSSIFHDPLEGLMGMFIMSLGEFAEIYEQFDCSPHSNMGKALFIVYMILVTLLLVNMLIATMGNTFSIVNETQKEWLRQWARIVLVVERTVSTAQCQRHRAEYAQMLSDGRQGLVLRWQGDEIERFDALAPRQRPISVEQKQHEDSIMQQQLDETLARIQTAI